MCLQYTFPRWILPYAVEATASWHNLRGLNSSWTLRIPKVFDIDFYMELFFSLRDDNVADVSKLMADRGVRAFDILEINSKVVTISEVSTHRPRDELTLIFQDHNGIPARGCLPHVA